MLLLLEQDEMLLLQSIVLLLKLAHLPLEFLDLLNMLFIDLKQSLILRGLVISELSLAFLDFDNASEEAFILLENGGSEIGVLHEVYVLHLSDHGLIFVILHVLECWQVQNLLGMRQLGYVVTFIQLSQLVDDGHSRVILSHANHFGNSIVSGGPSSLADDGARLLELRVLFSLAAGEDGIHHIILKLLLNDLDHIQGRSDLINNHLVTVDCEIEAGLGASCRGVGLVLL